MLNVLEDTLHGVRSELTWIISNRDDFRPPVPVITRMPKKASDPEWGAKLAAINKPETIACTDCDAESPDSLAVALAQGWTELAPDDGAGWNYLGLCPDCRAAMFEEDTSRPATERPDDDSDDDDKEESGNPAKTLF